MGTNRTIFAWVFIAGLIVTSGFGKPPQALSGSDSAELAGFKDRPPRINLILSDSGFLFDTPQGIKLIPPPPELKAKDGTLDEGKARAWIVRNKRSLLGSDANLLDTRDSAEIKRELVFKNFDAYWKRIEEENGMADLKRRLRKAHDIEHSWVPHAFPLAKLTDSAIVYIPPFQFFIRF